MTAAAPTLFRTPRREICEDFDAIEVSLAKSKFETYYPLYLAGSIAEDQTQDSRRIDLFYLENHFQRELNLA